MIILGGEIAHAQNFFLKGNISSNGSPVSNVHVYSSKYKFFCVSDTNGHYLLVGIHAVENGKTGKHIN